jgi:hypothetical protein
MSDDRGRGIGIGAPGLGKPLPSPDASCTAKVTIIHTYTDVWQGYTASDAASNRAKRLKEAGVKVSRHGNTVTWTDDQGVRTEIQFTDDPVQADTGSLESRSVQSSPVDTDERESS